MCVPGTTRQRADAARSTDCGAASRRELAGGDARHNARALRAVLEGEDRGPHRDCLLLGAALALEVAGKASRPREAIGRAAAAIDSGAAARVLEALARPAGGPA